MANFFEKWFGGKRSNPNSRIKRFSATVRRRIPRNVRGLKFDYRKVRLDNVSENSTYYEWALTLLAIFLAAAIASRVASLFLRPVYTPLPQKRIGPTKPASPAEDFGAIENRNIFDVENKIPDPFDQGLLDCLSQAKLSTARLQLMGTIVMRDEGLSVALIQDDTNQSKYAVKKDELFSDGKFTALKVDRRKLSFQMKSTQELEYIEIPEEGGLAGFSLEWQGSTEGVQPVSETSYVIKSNYLEKNLTNLNEIVQTAKAVPYTEGNKMKGFLIQSIDPSSPFTQLGLRQGDVLTGVNNIVLDNAGKGLEAFQQLRNASKIELKVTRGGQEQTLTYEVKQ